MTETADVSEVFALDADRVQEIRDLVRILNAPRPAADPDTRRLLSDCRDALRDLLADRDALVKANSEAAEELALWTGAV